MRCPNDRHDRETLAIEWLHTYGSPSQMLTTLPPIGRLTVVCAHPDDESFGLGAVVSTLIDRGSHIDLLCFTRGEAEALHGVDGDLSTIRAGELTAAGAVLGIGETRLLDYADGGLWDQPLDELGHHEPGSVAPPRTSRKSGRRDPVSKLIVSSVDVRSSASPWPGAPVG